MKASLLAAILCCACVAQEAQFAEDGKLKVPATYREWIFLSSGLGMTYGPNAPAAGSPQRFDNVFVNPPAYRHFLRTGTWPDGTVLVLEVRESQSKGSINQHGHFQTSVVAVEANVKDAKRFGDNGWGYFDLTSSGKLKTEASPIAAGNRCQQCHSTNGAVDSTFVQFYPELIPVATRFGTFKSTNTVAAAH